MTTVITDGKYIACDSLITDGDYCFSKNTSKVHRVGGSLVGFCGELQSGLAYIQWLKNNKVAKEKPNVSEDNFAALILNNDGVFAVDNMLILMRPDLPYAIGTGAPYAIGAVYAGASVKEAVQIACKLDSNSGGKVRVYEL